MKRTASTKIGSFNLGYYSNPEVDTLSEKISLEMNTKNRKTMIQDVYYIAMNDVAWIPLYTPQYLYGCNNIFDWNPGNCGGYCVEDIGFK